MHLNQTESRFLHLSTFQEFPQATVNILHHWVLRAHSPVDDVDHAVLTVIGAVNAQLVQQVQQQRAEVTVKLTDGAFKAWVGLQGIYMLS